MNIFKTAAMVSALTLTLAACGDGGGSTPDPVKPVPPVPDVVVVVEPVLTMEQSLESLWGIPVETTESVCLNETITCSWQDEVFSMTMVEDGGVSLSWQISQERINNMNLVPIISYSDSNLTGQVTSAEVYLNFTTDSYVSLSFEYVINDDASGITTTTSSTTLSIDTIYNQTWGLLSLSLNNNGVSVAYLEDNSISHMSEVYLMFKHAYGYASND